MFVSIPAAYLLFKTTVKPWTLVHSRTLSQGQAPTADVCGETIAAGLSKTPAHSSKTDGPSFMSRDKTIGVKVSYLIYEPDVSSIL